MLLSVPLWAITIAHSGVMFGLHLMITQLPIFLSSIMGLSIKQVCNSVLYFLSEKLACYYYCT